MNLSNVIYERYSQRELEAAAIKLLMEHYCSAASSEAIYDNNSERISECERFLQDNNFSPDIENVISFFETFEDTGAVSHNGIVFTPLYIAKYMVKLMLASLSLWNEDIRILDPCCGCGIFLLALIEEVHDRFNIPVRDIIENNLYGFDILNENVRRCRSILKVVCLKYNESYAGLNDNIFTLDSLRVDWSSAAGVKDFDFIIGNPPYVSSKDMDKSTLDYIRTYFRTSSGMSNLCETFIEKSIDYLSKSGKCCFIVQNTFLNSANSSKLRDLLRTEELIDTIIDYTDTHIFDKAKAYSCIILLDRNKHKHIRYSSPSQVEADNFILLSKRSFSKDGFYTSSESDKFNIDQLERFSLRLAPYMRMQICTFYDSIYLVLKDDSGFYAAIDNERYEIEDGIVKPVYKVSDFSRTGVAARHIICPYINEKIIDEALLAEKYPKTYHYLKSVKSKLIAREKGKINPDGWYAYGRKQGLKTFSRKILFPNYMDKPSFYFIEDDALFMNGGAIIENGTLPLDSMLRILNSPIMAYYLKQKSKAIRGGYYLCNKSAIGNFSIPRFSRKEEHLLISGSDDEINQMLISKYKLRSFELQD